ncbi:hypothetical protein TSAR_005076 [Trichomalopsis sarcophagae]|uniref:Uncharacterized protein n=1 Tax=Trichomalopsis sarcophagae TaxID=543379 RepID=A0A232EGD2_9HYME|nr:hypothetical protein TSAR_005076 [Trichomalopsis sarcophagae]
MSLRKEVAGGSVKPENLLKSVKNIILLQCRYPKRVLGVVVQIGRVGAYHHYTARPQVADRGTAPEKEDPFLEVQGAGRSRYAGDRKGA